MNALLLQWLMYGAERLAPSAGRAQWRARWAAQTGHYSALLRERGLSEREIRARLRQHSRAAFCEAWGLRARHHRLERVGAVIRKPAFCLGTIAAVLVIIVAGSHGLATTRAMLAPPYPDAGRLVLISEAGIMMGERLTVAPRLLGYWKAHATSFDKMAAYTWDRRGTGWATPGFADLLGAPPGRFLLHNIRTWKTLNDNDSRSLAVIARLKPGVSIAEARRELRDLAFAFRHGLKSYPFPEPEVVSLVATMREPLDSYATISGVTVLLLVGVASVGMFREFRRSRRVRPRYWAYFFGKAVGAPTTLVLAAWEFTGATSLTVAGGATFFAEPLSTWLFITACGIFAWWCLLDQRSRCRACLRSLQYPARVGSLGAILFDHAGTELICCEGHGALYLPELSSDYVQDGGWTTLNCADVPRP